MKKKLKVIKSGGRLRVTPVRGEGFVQFPKALRIEGAIYEATCYDAMGPAGGTFLRVDKKSIKRVA